MRKRAAWPLSGRERAALDHGRAPDAGRGRRGRAWESAGGNLAATLAAAARRAGQANGRNCPLSPPSRRPTWRRISRRRARIAVKWPNDVLADGKKLAGILLESGQWPGAWLAIGIGVNLAHHPARHRISRHLAGGAGRTAPPSRRCAWPCSPRASPIGMMSGRTQGFARHPRRLAGAGGRAGHAHPGAAGRRRNASGMFEGIDENGALLLNEGFGRAQRHCRRRDFLRVTDAARDRRRQHQHRLRRL